ncbi:TIGR01777 family protein [Psychromonas sp. psych-6C06]|uniref:TIGR01777 family oxidoreductase n=1 Tax=Psychromonas sp. psych-6C06 TaxID=2058089 RepID=UPI000C33D446|nr:TIGR01777 family oxidoreductase [Psychromonas sp. psych-6C06]PKF60752.1 TIGR01777 family protein [Psychromonas sp. psych-6C06]
MKILIIGSSGLIGSALVPYLEKQGYEVGRLLRHKQDHQPYWMISPLCFHLKQFSHPDIIINLAGENIADGRWNEKRKQQLIRSRIETTQLITEQFKNNPPSLFINASAIGFYGERGSQPLDETSKVGEDFVSQLAEQWEASCSAIESSDTRLVKIRTGIVLSKAGGALPKMLPAFKFGLGGKIGSGEQYMSWIDINDFCHAIQFIIQHETLTGPINLVSPNPVDNQTFSKALSKQLSRPCLFPLPAFMVNILFGEMGKELLLASTRVKPQKLLQAGFQFEYERLQDSLNKQLK